MRDDSAWRKKLFNMQTVLSNTSYSGSYKKIHWYDIAILIIVYFIAARLGQLVAIPPGNVTPFWPAAGIILYAVVARGPRIWPGIWLGAMIGNGWAYYNVTGFGSLLEFLLATNLNGAGDTLCALFGYYMIKRVVRPDVFMHSSGGVLMFIIFASVIGSMISATLGVSGLCVAGVVPWSSYLYTWLTWTVGDGVGMLVVTPLLLYWMPTGRADDAVNWSVESMLFLSLVVVASLIGLGMDFSGSLPNYAAAYTAFPVLIWAVYRYGPGISFTTVATISTIAIVLTALGTGMFVSTSINDSLIQLQMFVAVATITTLFMNAAILERKAAILSLQRSRDEIETVNHELEAFSYSLSHDLRSPVRTITSFSQILKNDASQRLNPEEKDYLDRIIRSGKHMASLIDDTISLALVSHQELVTTEVDISAICRKLQEGYQQQYSGIDTRVIIEEGITVTGDQQLLSIVMDNLVGNAWKYSQKEARPLVEIYQDVLDGRQAICVRDNGVGFDESYKHKLFDVFQRFYSYNEFPGTGIGLATVRRIILRHQGHVWADGRPGEGACFCFTLWDRPRERRTHRQG